jgi:hypothetical protein
MKKCLRAWAKVEKILAAGPISRILSAGRIRQDDHSSGPRITAAALATYPEVVTRRAARALAEARLPPYLVLLHVGLALPAALLPRRCALTAPFHPYPHSEECRRYVLCGTFRRVDLNPPSRTLSGTLLCGVRTFLSPHPKTRKATVRSSCQLNHYTRLPVFGFRQGWTGPQTSDARARTLHSSYDVKFRRLNSLIDWSRASERLGSGVESPRSDSCISLKPSASHFNHSG